VTNDLLTTGWRLHQAGDLTRAEETYRQLLRLEPTSAQGWYLLGVLRQAQGDGGTAQTCFQQALRLRPDLVEAHNNLGNLFHEQKRLAEAEASYRAAARLRPEIAVLHNNLGVALLEQERFPEAIDCFQRALQLQPSYALAENNLGSAFWRLGRFEESLASYTNALRIQPACADFHRNHANVLKDLGQLDDALAAYRTALRLRPDAALTHSFLILTMLYHPDSDAESIFVECRRWNEQHARPLEASIQPHANCPDPQRRLRVGYVSPDFRDGHVDSHFLAPLLAHHDHEHFEIFCYANVARPDAMTARLRDCADAWRSTVGLSDRQAAEVVRSDQIDILVDLELHAGNNRLLLFAHKPAPVQVAWLGHPGTTGLTAIDYRLSDPHLDPPGLFDAYSSEEVFRLADTFWCYDPLIDAPLTVNKLPAAETGIITFGCLNNFCKVNDGVLKVWAKILHTVPRSRLLLRAPRGGARERVLTRLQQEGVEGSRVEFADGRPRQEYLQLYERIDVSLDPFPYNGHTTSLDAYWMGVPTITLIGQTVVGRAGWSQLCNLGLQELAARNADEYVRLASELAGDLPRLQELRATLRQRLERSALMDGPRFARQVEQAYRQMWRRWCRSGELPGAQVLTTVAGRSKGWPHPAPRPAPVRPAMAVRPTTPADTARGGQHQENPHTRDIHPTQRGM
jgi:predicted O-linked N-acetylglucosamine transferase (SPINDLY family)